MVLASTLKNCQKLKKLDLTDYLVGNDYKSGLANLADVKPKFTHMEATIHSKYSFEIEVILYLINNASTVATINIDRIDTKEFMDRIVAAGISLSKKVRHNVEMNLKWIDNTVTKELPTNMPDNLTVRFHF